MAKKASARSKGYRTYQKKKEVRQWTDQEKQLAKRVAIAVAALIVVIVIVALAVRNIGVLKVKDGVVQNVQENWVLRNVGTNSKPRVYRLATVDQPLEGFELETPDRTVSQGLYNIYRSTDESAFPASYTLGGAAGEYDAIAQTVRDRLVGEDEDIEIVSTTLAGKKVSYFIRANTVDLTEAGEGTESYQYL